MVYIPTIHTFEDDVNENRGFDEAPISGGTDKIYNSNILVPEKKESSLTKKILTFISVIFILGSVAIIGYYFYGKYKIKKEEAALNLVAEQNMNTAIQNQNIENNLKNIFPLLSIGIAPYIQNSVEKNNIIVLTIKDNTGNEDNFSLLYAYILAHKKDLNSDLFTTFQIKDLAKNTNLNTDTSSGTDEGTNQDKNNINMDFASSNTDQGSSTLTKLSSTVQDSINSFTNKITEPTPISSEELNWESKTLNNQDFEVANAGVVTLIYGYVGQKYLIFTTSLKDFFDTINSIQ